MANKKQRQSLFVCLFFLSFSFERVQLNRWEINVFEFQSTTIGDGQSKIGH